MTDIHSYFFKKTYENKFLQEIINLIKIHIYIYLRFLQVKGRAFLYKVWKVKS